MKHLISIILVYGAMVTIVSAEKPSFYSWSPWETDSVLTAWAIKRYVFQGAIFASVPKGETLEMAQAINTPDANYRRSGTKTAFEMAVYHHQLQFACLPTLKPLIRLLELAPWRKSTNSEAVKFEYHIKRLLPSQPQQHGLEPAFQYIDQYCQTHMKNKK